MDLIYANGSTDIGVLKDYEFDMAIGKDENNFECKVYEHCCSAGWYLYIEGTDYGGIIDRIQVATLDNEITYSGRTWSGILNSKVIEPDSGSAYLILNGNANTVISSLITRMGLADLFTVDVSSSPISISKYQMDRYIKGYDGIVKMLKAHNSKLKMFFRNGKVVLSAVPAIDYTIDEQFDVKQLDIRLSKIYRPINHVVCLGKGELTNREVIHVYADSTGAIVPTKTMNGLLEVTDTYENTNAESSDELRKGGLEIIQNSFNSNELEFDFNSNDSSYDIGDEIGTVEYITGIAVKATINKKIVQIKDGLTTIYYKVGV